MLFILLFSLFFHSPSMCRLCVCVCTFFSHLILSSIQQPFVEWTNISNAILEQLRIGNNVSKCVWKKQKSISLYLSYFSLVRCHLRRDQCMIIHRRCVHWFMVAFINEKNANSESWQEHRYPKVVICLQSLTKTTFGRSVAQTECENCTIRFDWMSRFHQPFTQTPFILASKWFSNMLNGVLLRKLIFKNGFAFILSIGRIMLNIVFWMFHS